MRLNRVYSPQPLAVGRTVQLSATAAQHVARVLRLRIGAPLVLFDGQGCEFSARLVAIGKREVQTEITQQHFINRESPLKLRLLQGIARGDKMDTIVQKATELGVNEIWPVITERSVSRLSAEQRVSKQSHWQAVAVSACEQCGRNRLPQIRSPLTFGEILDIASDAKLILVPDANTTLVAAAKSYIEITLLVGPEGGFTDKEIQSASDHGFVACQLGPRILRTETAALAALATLQAINGDFR